MRAVLPVSTPLHQVILHAEYAAASVTYTLWYGILNIIHRAVSSEIAKLTLTGNITAGMNGRILLVTDCITFLSLRDRSLSLTLCFGSGI